MKKAILLFSFVIVAFMGFSQAAYILPSPTGKNDTITLYVNVAATTDGNQNGVLKAMLTDHPLDSVYLWTWMPSTPVIGNGEWTASNEGMKMTLVTGQLYSIRFKPTSFYGVDATEFFSKGISCLAKLKNGGDYAGLYSGEAKTEDMHVNVIPKLCEELYCAFPEIAKSDDFFSITYDNNKETNPDLQNLDDDECFLFMRAEQTVFNAFNYATPELTTTTPALQMKPIAGSPGFFRLTILPEDFFAGIVPANFNLKTLKYYVLKPGYVYTGAPPLQPFTFLNCD